MFFVAFVVGFWVDVSGIRVGVMYGYADFINEVSGCGVMGLRGAKGCSAGCEGLFGGCSSSVMESSGGGSASLSCSSSLESRTRGGWFSCPSSMYGD